MHTKGKRTCMTLEEKLAKLDAMTEQLRKEDITLEESFSLYKDGM